MSGGGSGHLEFALFQMRPNETLSLTLEGPGKETRIEKDGVKLLVAAPGQSSNAINAGHGYSGGGVGVLDRLSSDNTGSDGGSDGSDGHSSGGIRGGKGSGLDLATLNMTRFVLTPGKAGTGYRTSGGGGGGVLVNGKKPYGGISRRNGEGFGGGKGGRYYDAKVLRRVGADIMLQRGGYYDTNMQRRKGANRFYEVSNHGNS